MTHFIDYQVGMQLYVPPMFGDGDGLTVTVDKVDAEYAYIVGQLLRIDVKTHCILRGYRQMVYSSKEQYQQIKDEHKAYLNDIRFMDNVVWSELDADQVMDLLKIACPQPQMLKPEPFIWHELTAHQLAQMVWVVESAPCE